jgi:hypothetical protein
MRPRPEGDVTATTALWTALAGLVEKIPGIESVQVGENTSPEGLDRGFTLGFVVRFVDAAARDGYLPHPDHVAVVPLVQAVAEEVLVFDLDADGSC